MRFYNQAHAFYCGVDLHARTMYLCILDQVGRIVLHEDVPAEAAALFSICPTPRFRAGSGRGDRGQKLRFHVSFIAMTI